MRQSLDLINWEKAQEKVRQWEAQGYIDREPPSPASSSSPAATDYPTNAVAAQLPTIDHAVKRYFQDLVDRGLAYSTIRKDRIIIER